MPIMRSKRQISLTGFEKEPTMMPSWAPLAGSAEKLFPVTTETSVVLNVGGTFCYNSLGKSNERSGSHANI